MMRDEISQKIHKLDSVPGEGRKKFYALASAILNSISTSSKKNIRVQFTKVNHLQSMILEKFNRISAGV
jgi:hypothetical protein